MSLGARIFVAVVFIILGISFITTTAVFYNEFHDTNWLSFAAFYSHLFIFFPTFGLVALAAFYIPAVIFTDMYWNHVRFGKIRFLIGMVVVVGGSYLIALQLLKGDIPAVWDIAPRILKADRGEPAGCKSDQQSCLRVPVLESVVAVRKESQRRFGLSKFARECHPDPLLELPEELLEKRYCFVTKTLLQADACCQAQKRFNKVLMKMHKPKSNRSRTGIVHATLLPLKVFFLLVLLTLGIMLAIWRRKIDHFYGPYVPLMERGLIIGAAVMLLWPFSNHAFLQSASVLYGAYGKSLYAVLAPLFSILFGAWALMLLFFFFRRFDKDMEAAGKIIGVIGSAVAIFKYDAIIDYSVRIAGSGADQITFVILAVAGFFAFVPLFYRRRQNEDGETEDDSDKAEKST